MCAAYALPVILSVGASNMQEHGSMFHCHNVGGASKPNVEEIDIVPVRRRVECFIETNCNWPSGVSSKHITSVEIN